MKIIFCTRYLLLLPLAMLFMVVVVVQSESNRIAAMQLNYAKPLLFYTILCSWWPMHAFAITQIDAHSDAVSNTADDATPATVTATGDQSTAHLYRTPSMGLHSSSSSAPTLSPQHFAILDLRARLNRQLKSMHEKELLVPTIQNLFDSLDPIPLSAAQNDTKILNQMVLKMEAKLWKAIETVAATGDQIGDIIAAVMQSTDSKSQQQSYRTRERILLETIVLPCSTDARYFDHDVTADERSRLALDDNKSIEILNYLSHAAGHLHETNDKNFTTNSRILEELKKIQTSAVNWVGPNSVSFRDIFFLAADNYASVSNCRRYYPNEEYRRLLISHLKSKRLMMIIDNGGSIASYEDQFDVTKSLAKNIIKLLGDDDQLTIVGATGESDSFNTYMNARQSMPSHETLYQTTRETKQYFYEFLLSLNKTNTNTNHTLAFEYAFQLMRNVTRAPSSSESSPVLMLYISRGRLTDAKETKNVLETIAFGQSRLAQPVVICTCAILFDENRDEDKQFLTDLSDQNYSKFNVDLPSSGTNRYWHREVLRYRRGKTYTITSTNVNEISLTSIAVLADIWYEKDNMRETHIQIHEPVYDSTAKDHIISITKSCGDRGVFGVGLYFTELTEDFVYYFNKYADSDESYAFLVDLNGTTISHPSFARPQLELKDDVYPTDIRFLEKIEDEIWQRWRDEESGNVTIISADRFKKVYTWQRISNHYVGCLVRVWSYRVVTNSIAFDANQIQNISKHFDESRSDLIFHRLDLVHKDAKLCHYFKQLSVHDKITLFLSAGAFKSPVSYMRSVCPMYSATSDVMREHCAQSIESIMAFIRDTTNLLANPGLHTHVRNDIWDLFKAMELLRARHDAADDSTLSPYIIRRYVTSMNGVVLMYPGVVLPNDFEPSKRIWFRMAADNVGKLVVTTPYLDAGGAGYIVTVSHAIQVNVNRGKHHRERHEKQRKRRRRQHVDDFSENQKTIAIVSIDVTRGFFYHSLMLASDYCQNGANIKCFLIDDMGYLVAHPSVLEPHGNAGYAQAIDVRRWIVDHITHKESFIANDILLHKHLVEKRLCQNLRSRKIQRFYKFNTSEVDVLGNVVNGERSKYVVTAIPNTNLLTVMLNSTDGDGSAAFCPCSTVDRICFNCNRIELMNCECPCECPLKSLTMQTTIKEYQYGDLMVDANEEMAARDVNLFESVEICPTPIEEYHPVKGNPTANLDGLNACVKYSCEQYTNQFDCLGILGCEWCQIDIDAETLLTSPFCTHQSVCFGGILGSATPYGDGDLGAVVIDSMLPSAYAAIGPVVGAIVVLCFIIGVAMYCYRNNVEPGTEQLFVESSPFEFGLPLSRLDYESTVPDGTEKRNNIPRTGSSDISPYRMHAGNFRRPNGESDHGYSTMTPHEDSDHACFTLIEPLINSKQMSHSDSTSINGDPICTNLSSPNSYSQPMDKETKTLITNNGECGYDNTGATHLSSPHHIQVPVIVHQPMEATI